MRRRLSLILAALGGLVLLVIVVFGALLVWLLLTAPSPREVEGWELGPALPSARGELAMAVAESEEGVERLYVIGGFGGLLASPQDKVTWLEADADEWDEGPSLPAARHHLAAAGLGDAVYVSGGSGSRLGSWTPGDNFWRLVIGAGEWEELEAMSEGRWGHRMVEHDGRLYVIGGQGESGDVLIYTPGEGWARGAPMPAPRDHLSVVVAEGRIWAIGGRDSGSMERVDIYDPETDAWEPGPPLPEPTSGAAEGVVDGLILVYGGEDPGVFGGGVFDRHWMLDPAAESPQWQPAPQPPLAVHGSEGAVFEGTLVIAGGAGRHGALSVTSWTDAVQRMEPGALGGE